jgi:hypothetical protein
MPKRRNDRATGISRCCTYGPAVILALFPVASPAYLGPGAGLGMLGSLVAVVVAVLLAIAGLFILPFRLLMKRRNRNTNENRKEKERNSRDIGS